MYDFQARCLFPEDAEMVNRRCAFVSHPNNRTTERPNDFRSTWFFEVSTDTASMPPALSMLKVALHSHVSLIYRWRTYHLSLHYRHHTYPFGPKENFAYRNQTKSKRTDMLRASLRFLLRRSVPGLRPAIGTQRSISMVGSGRRQGRFKVLYLIMVCCG